MTTKYHAKYWAHALVNSGHAGSIDKITRSISNARVDLNPHQVEAALFGLNSPLSKGTILADEVGLGKTIEAGLVLSQRFAERRKKILLVLPATLRKQWQQELDEKFYLPSLILESRIFNKMRKEGERNPFDQKEQIVICSYHFAAAKKDEIRSVPWDLVVIDEAHRMRNIYKRKNKIAKAVAEATEGAHKLLLTATPLQNSLMELFGLVSVVDDHIFGDPYSFRAQFTYKGVNEEMRNAELRERLSRVCKRTLRKQVNEYVRFTSRVSMTEEFTPTDEEHELYERISAYLQRDELLALPRAQRKLMTLVLRKLLASSTFAIGSTLKKLVGRLEDLKEAVNKQEEIDIDGVEENDEPAELKPTMEDEFETIKELQEEWDGENGEWVKIDTEKLKSEIKNELSELCDHSVLADRITTNAKGEALIRALSTAFLKAEELGAARKAVIFTESRKTQDYLYKLLCESGYDNKVVMINGTNADQFSASIYKAWLSKHEGEDTVSGSKSVDIKAAIVEEFRDNATIMVATEAAAEGINLQFCSMLVNYDLPWNPQRIEQRIGRCHRYGQKHDVVVVNFLNRKNAADQRVFELLKDKFRLFDGVFGASDEILGAIESGVDIEKRIAEAYQTCRTQQEIKEAFDKLQLDLDEQIQARMEKTRKAVLDHFDEEVHLKLRFDLDATKANLSQRERQLLDLTKFELNEVAEFDSEAPRFNYTGDYSTSGFYNLNWKDAQKNGEIFYRTDHKLAKQVIGQAIVRSLPVAHLTLDYDRYGAKISTVENLLGTSGWLSLSKLTVNSLQKEEYLVFSGVTDDGKSLDHELCEKLMKIPGEEKTPSETNAPNSALDKQLQKEIDKRCKSIADRNEHFFEEEFIKLNHWSDDLKLGLEQEIKDIDSSIKEARRLALLAPSLQEKLEAQKKTKTLESARNKKRRELFDSQDTIEAQRDELLSKVEKQLQQNQEVQSLFTTRWSVI